MRTLKIWNWATCLLAAVMLAGCGGSSDYRETTDKDLEPVPEEHHSHAAPHGGLLVELGEHEYNVELVVSEAEPKLTLYVLGAHAETAVPVTTEAITLTLGEGDTASKIALTAMPQDGEADGVASMFVSAGAVPETLKATKDLHGDISVMIDEREFMAHFHGEDAHDDHDHDHGDHEHGDHDHDDDHADEKKASDTETKSE